MTDPRRLHSRPMVQSSLSTRLVDVALSGLLTRFLMVDRYLCRLWYLGQPPVCNLCAVQGHRSANCPKKDKCRKCGRSGTLLGKMVPLTGQRETLRIFLPCPHLYSLRRPVILLTLSFLRITSSIYCRLTPCRWWFF